jgi:ParB/RepB/Spo0J family partition protein
MKAKPLQEKMKKMGLHLAQLNDGSKSEEPAKAKAIDVFEPEPGLKPFSKLLANGLPTSLGLNAEIPVDQIVTSPERKRKLTPDERARLKHSIEQEGLWSPITVEQIDDDKFKVIAGHNRLDICVNDLHWTSIPVKVVKISTSADKAAFISNLLQPELSTAEIYFGLSILRSDADGCRMSNREIAKETGFSEPFISQILTMDRLSPNLVASMYEAKVLVGANILRDLVTLLSDPTFDKNKASSLSDDLINRIKSCYEDLYESSGHGGIEGSVDAKKHYWTRVIKRFIAGVKRFSDSDVPPKSAKFDPKKQRVLSLSRQSSQITLQFNSENDAQEAEKILLAQIQYKKKV